MASAVPAKGHWVPPSDATHPQDCWETAFVYAFIVNFTTLRTKIEGFESPMDFENALMSPEQHPHLMQILSRFILNIKPQTRNLTPEVVTPTISALLVEYFKTGERTMFWDDSLGANKNPLVDVPGGFWGGDWRLKLRILRALVELQLTKQTDVKKTIDKAYGVNHRGQAPAEPSSSETEKLMTAPLGQDRDRKRYWAFDNSPRLYISTNPWKITSAFKTLTTSKDEYVQLIDQLKEVAPKEPKLKPEHAHISLIEALESRLPLIENELARVQRVRRKIQQRDALAEQAVIRSVRTRRQTKRPDYNYDDYGFVDGEDGDWQPEEARSRSSGSPDIGDLYLSERRMSKRVKTSHNTPPVRELPERNARVETTPSSSSSDTGPTSASAATVKPHEVAVDAVAGKKKSKFWFYAVETVSQPAAPAPDIALASGEAF